MGFELVPGTEHLFYALIQRMNAGELTSQDVLAEYKRLTREAKPQTIEIYAAALRRKTVLLERAAHLSSRDPRTPPPRTSAAPRRPRSRRVRAGARGPRSPGRSTDDDPLDPPARVLYEHAAAFRGIRRVAAWLEAWADEMLEASA